MATSRYRQGDTAVGRATLKPFPTPAISPVVDRSSSRGASRNATPTDSRTSTPGRSRASLGALTLSPVITNHTRTRVDTLREEIRKRDKRTLTTPPPRSQHVTASPEADANRKAERIQALHRVFAAFDLDGGGYIEAAELLELGKARRMLGQKSGEWTEEKNAKIVRKMDANGDGLIGVNEFSEFFEKALPYDTAGFDATIVQFEFVAQACSQRKAQAIMSTEQPPSESSRGGVLPRGLGTAENERVRQLEDSSPIKQAELKKLADLFEEQQKADVAKAALHKQALEEEQVRQAQQQAAEDERLAAMQKHADLEAKAVMQKQAAKEQEITMREQAEQTKLAALRKQAQDLKQAAMNEQEELIHKAALQKRAEQAEARQVKQAQEQAELVRQVKQAQEQAERQAALQAQEVDGLMQQMAASQVASASEIERSVREALVQQAEQTEQQRTVELQEQASAMDQRLRAALTEQAQRIEAERSLALQQQAVDMKRQIDVALAAQAQLVQAERKEALERQAEAMSHQMEAALSHQAAQIEQQLQGLKQQQPATPATSWSAVPTPLPMLLPEVLVQVEELRRLNSARKIQRWWFSLWEEDLSTFAETASWLEHDEGHQAVADYIDGIQTVDVTDDEGSAEDTLRSIWETEMTPISPSQLDCSFSFHKDLSSENVGVQQILEQRHEEAMDEMRSPRMSPQRVHSCDRHLCVEERAQLAEELKYSNTEAKHLEAELKRVQVESARLGEHANEAAEALYVTKKKLDDCHIQLEQLKPLRMQHLMQLLQSVVQKKLLRRRVRVMASLLREAKVPWAVDIKASHNVLIEFAVSEKAYVESLRVLVETFFPGIASFGEDIDREPHMRGAYSAMETTVETLFTKHSELAELLHQIAHLKTGADASLMEVMDKLCASIRGDYDGYLAHLSKVLQRVEKLQQTNKPFAAAMKSAIRKNTRKGKGLGISSFLYQPLQRIAGYTLLCERLASTTSSEHLLFQERLACATQIQAASRYVDERVGNFVKVEKLFDRFRLPLAASVSALAYVGQRIVQQGELYLVGEWFATMNHCFLLQDAFLFATPEAQLLPHAIKLDTCECSIAAECKKTLVFQGPEMALMKFRAADEAACTQWYNQIIECRNHLISIVH